MTFDKDGFLWIGTELGLVRFDGSRFKTFNHNNTPQLIADRIVKVGLLNDHSIYLRDEKNNLYQFNNRQQLQRMDVDAEMMTSGGEQGFLNLQRLWKHPGNEGLETRMRPHLPGHTLFVTAGDSNRGYLLFGGMHYMAYVDHYTVRWIDSIENYPGWNDRFIAGYRGRFYYLNDHNRLCTIDSLGKRHIITIIAGRHEVGSPGTPVISRVLDGGGRLFGVIGNALWELSAIDSHTLGAKPVLNLTNLPGPLVYQNYKQADIQAMGHATKGLFIAAKSPFTVIRPPAPASPVMYSQSLMTDNSVLTNADVLPAGSRSLEIPANQINRLSIFRDNRHHYWLTHQDYLCELNEHLNIIRKIYFPFGTIQCFQQTSDGTIWISENDYRHHESRLGKIAGDSIIWQHTNPGKIYNETFVALNDHLFWLGNKNGLQELDVQKGTVRNFPLFDQSDVRSIYKDRKGIIWVGTYGNGFYARYNGRFIKLPQDRKGYLSTAHTFLEDRKGFLWITTNKGLFQIQTNDLYAYLRDSTIQLYYHYYDKSDGLPTNEFNGGCNPAGVIFEDGKFSLPTMDGLVQFYPDSITPRQPANKIFIDEVWIDSSCITSFSHCELPASFNRISISISAPYFGNPYNQYIEYNLKGLNDNWYPINEDNTIIFNRLSQGKYELQLRKKAGFGANNMLITRFSFSVQPGFFDTWTFKIMLLVLAALLVFAIIQFRFRYLVRNKQLLEKEVATRTDEQKRLIEELQTAISELEHSREELFYNNRFKEKLALLITHDLQSPLRFLSVMCEQLNKKAAGNDDREIADSSNEIKNTAKQIHAFVEEFGLWATTQQESFRIQITHFSLKPLMEELVQFFREMMLNQGNQLIIDIDPLVTLKTDRQLLKIILRNLIDNANKYTTNGILRVVLETKGNMATIGVHDNGRGIQEEELRKIRHRIEQNSRGGLLDKDSRLGYQIIVDFAGRLQAALSLHSLPQQGTSILISEIECLETEVKSH